MVQNGRFHNINIFVMSIKSMFVVEKKLHYVKLNDYKVISVFKNRL